MAEINESKKEIEGKLKVKSEIEHKSEAKMEKMELKKEGMPSKSMFSTSLNILKEKESKKNLLMYAAVFLVAYSFLYGFWRIPIVDFGINRTSPIGIYDYLFVIAVSVLTSIFLSLFLYERRNKLASASSIGGIGGGFACFVGAICPVCQSLGIVAFGSTLLNIPTAFLVPYLGFLKFASIGLLGMAVYFKADSIHNKKCRGCEVKTIVHETSTHRSEPFLLKNNIAFASLVLLVLLVSMNNLLIPRAFATTALSAGSGGVANLGSFEYGPKITLKPMPLAHGEQPVIQGYKSKVKPLPTISELTMKPLTGNAAQDLVNNVVPTGTPWYGQQAGVTFDDPIKSQNLWAKGRAIQLTPEEEQRWSRITNSFTCDYCCGSPQNPTIITRCGCAHSSAAQGMAKWFIKNYGSSYSDEEIYGEMARWYALWYPGPTVKRIIQEAQAA